MNKEISVVICTHNQAGYLNKSLDSLVSQTLPQERFEVIVVDNASRDHTKDVLLNFAALQNFRCIHEPILGLSVARNTGWKNARGDYVAFLDSDAVASPEWLERISGRFASARPETAAVGGRIVPIWQGRRPEWLSKDLETYLGIIDWSDKPLIIDDGSPYYLAGSNLAFRKNALEKTNGFCPSLGRLGKRLLSNEEILLQRQLTQMNMSLVYDPGICVHHHVKSHCLHKKWFYQRLFWQGISDVIVERQLVLMRGNAWHSLPQLRRNFSLMFSETIKHFKEVLKRADGRFASRSRIFYWIGRIVCNSRILIDWT